MAGMRALGRRWRDEAGFTPVEVVVAIGLTLVILLSMSGLLTSIRRLTGEPGDESDVSAVAARRLDSIREIDFDRLALRAAPSHAEDPADPDFDVGQDGTTYDTGAAIETLVVDAERGQVDHLNRPETPGTSDLRIYAYVTWPEDPPTASRKRVTLVLSWRPSPQGTANRITLSTLVARR